MEITTLPLSGSRNDRTVTTALSQGVARTTTSARGGAGVVRTGQRQVPVRPARHEVRHDALGPLRVTRADRHLEPGLGEPDREPASGRACSTQDSHVHGPTFA